MSLLQSLEIDSLKLRNLVVKTANNSVYPVNYQIYSKGDGNTYWSSGVTGQQFIQLSTHVSSIESTVIGLQKEVPEDISTVYGAGVSTLFGISTFTQNLSTFSAAQAYTDTKLGAYSTQLMSTLPNVYASLTQMATYSTSVDNAMNSSIQSATNAISSISSQIRQTNLIVATNSTYTTSTLFATLSTYTTTKFITTAAFQAGVTASTYKYVDDNDGFIKSLINDQSSIIGQNYTTASAYPIQWGNADSAVSTNAGRAIYSTLILANAFTSQNISTIDSTVTYTLSASISTLTRGTASTLSSFTRAFNSTTINVVSTLVTVSSGTGQAISTMNANISSIFQTGLLANIYQTFIELQGYSVQIIESTLSTSNNAFASTVSTYNQIYLSTLNYINVSSFDYLVEQAYQASISTLIPVTNSTLSSVISSQTGIFESTIAGDIVWFESSISSLLIFATEEVSSFISTAGQQVSSVFGQGLSIQMALYSTTIQSASTFVGTANNSTVSLMSIAVFSQFVTAPSIILNRINNLSTLTNVTTVTGLSSLVAGIANLDITLYDNFYILLSDISADIYYGITYSTNVSSFTNRDITVQIDVQSSYSNKFMTFDTDNLSGWLNRPKIINPNSFSLMSVGPSWMIPSGQTIQQVHLSTFIGAYILDLRITQKGMFLKNVMTYPYIYSRLQVQGYAVPINVEVSNPALDQSTFVYRGSLMPMEWTTNDLNIPLGIKFMGTGLEGESIVSWAGPYRSGDLQAAIRLPTALSPLVKYHTMYFTVFPNNTMLSGSMEGNINAAGQVFCTEYLDPPIHVVNPSLNSQIRVFNSGGESRYLQVAELWVNNSMSENVITDKFNSYANFISTSSYPFNGDINGFGAYRAFDGNRNTYFYGGSNAINFDSNAFLQGTFSTFSPTFTSTTMVSSIEVYAGANLGGLDNMVLKIQNWNEPGLQNGLFFSSMNLTSKPINVLSFNA
jgi:hypothetical protein